jgi:hypothetical protein
MTDLDQKQLGKTLGNIADTAALAYYHDHREQIDQQIRDDDDLISRLRQENGPGLLDRLKGANLGDPVSSR